MSLPVLHCAALLHRDTVQTARRKSAYSDASFVQPVRSPKQQRYPCVETRRGRFELRAPDLIH